MTLQELYEIIKKDLLNGCAPDIPVMVSVGMEYADCDTAGCVNGVYLLQEELP